MKKIEEKRRLILLLLICYTDIQTSNFVNNWFDVIAFRLIQLKEKLN